MYKYRGYKRDNILLRDYKLFAIACEGSKREPEYFSLFENLSRRIKIDIIKESEYDESFSLKSSPRAVLERAVNYVENSDFIDEDELWLVIDVDKWGINLIKELFEHCNSKKNWHIAISNP
jgi:hypothetical protein